MAAPDIERLFDLQEFLHQFHFIKRVVHLPGKSDRSETDTEHSYTLAMTAWFISQYFADIDTDKCIKLALVHDLVEIYAGDTFAFASKELLDSKTKREKKALKKIRKEWQDFPQMYEAIDDYEALESPESKFIFALDKVMPPMVIFMGKGQTWRKHKITFNMHTQKKMKDVPISPTVLQYYKQLEKLMKQNIKYFHPDKK